MAEMTENEALSVLSALAQQADLYAAQNVALFKVKGVIEKYVEAKTGLKEQEDKIASLREVLGGLEAQYDQQAKALKARLKEEEATYTAEIASTRNRAQELRAEIESLTKDLEQKTLFSQRRAKELDAELKQKSDALQEVTEAYGAFQKKHGLKA